MRLICPRCGAQYEVDDVIIPTAGRDVQCSGCGQTWFQPSRQMLDAAQEKAREAQDGLDQWDVSAPEPEAATEAAAEPEAAAVAEEEDWPEPLPEDWPDFEAEPAPDPVAEAAPEAVPDPEAPGADAGAEILDWAVPATPAPAEPEPAELETAELETDVLIAISELMRSHPLAPAAEPIEPAATTPEPEPQQAEPEAPEPAPAVVPQPIETAEVGPAPRVGAIPRRPLDENLMAILREEAEREAAARRAEGSGIETQEEMNLDPVLTSPVMPTVAPPPPPPMTPPPMTPPSVQPQRVAPTLRAEPSRRMLDFSDLNSDDASEGDRHADLTEGPEPEEAESADRFLRRRRLPDIDEINSSLRASADRNGDIAAMGMIQGRDEDRSGFRFGFSSVLLLAAIAALLYAYAPKLAEMVPAAGPLLDSYVAAVDAARIWLDAQLRAVIAQVQAGAPPQS
ncbi:putative Zn finger-like uncharacterized protein [Rhodobacter viridis]|uniref:Putative Zn finger-like uncharacterized protein n=1 Tax=Rhodobacter viridis TaxID=1054202 RepID=A0A318TX88_9RHOB|nr:zinc-ribbon domain-containing protein [Rhodobacter viridis]PYF09312.1 putative Zn finger-like uncharacterized protein [Rhodobacter viridis]